jgi:hypothetical protein
LWRDLREWKDERTITALLGKQKTMDTKKACTQKQVFRGVTVESGVKW